MDHQTVYYRPLPTRSATILVIEKGQVVNTVLLNGSMSIGRVTKDIRNDIALTSSIAGRHHGELIWNEQEGVYYYCDCGSINGTYYNGTRIKQNTNENNAIRLSNNDVLRIDCDDLNTPHPEAVIMLYSTILTLEDRWKSFSLSGKSNVKIGRGIKDGISLSDFMVSRNHAILTKNKGSWIIHDQNSKNSLFVNKEMVISSRRLSPYDVIQIANTVLVYLGDRILYNECGSIAEASEQNRHSIIMSVDINKVEVKKFGAFSKKTLLKNIRFDVETSDFILILGGAGAGKSTLIKSLMGEIRADGKIMLEGIDLYKNFKMMKHKIGIVPQFSTTRDHDTVYHTIMDAAQVKLCGGYSQLEIENRVEYIIQRMRLNKIRDSYVSVISGGQKKRLEVAIQAIGNQEFFVLDEPDSGLDYASRVDQMRNLKACTETGCVVSVITHSPDDAADLFTKVIVLAKSSQDDIGYLAYYGDVPNALKFFGVKKLSEIVLEINSEGGKGRADEFIERFELTRRS